MKIPRNLNGAQLAEHLVRNWEYRIVHTTGSHIVCRTGTPTGHTVAIPAHKPLKAGTLDGILRSISTHKSCSKMQLLANL